VKSACNELRVREFHHWSSLEQVQPAAVPLARIILLDFESSRPLSSLETDLIQAVHAKPRDVVVGIGESYPGSTIAQWMKMGMRGYVDKPVNQDSLATAILNANEDCIQLRAAQSEYRLLQMQRTSITTREEEVLQLVVQGVPNKCIATRLDVSQRTIETRRQKIYRKMNANRLVDLIKSLEKLDSLSNLLSTNH
jgi:FixJ family two-component response regulator